MEDSSSVRSSESIATSEEYEIIESETTASLSSATVNAHSLEPTLNIANNGNMEDLQSQLSEVLQEKISRSPSPTNADVKMGCDQVDEPADLTADIHALHSENLKSQNSDINTASNQKTQNSNNRNINDSINEQNKLNTMDSNKITDIKAQDEMKSTTTNQTKKDIPSEEKVNRDIQSSENASAENKNTSDGKEDKKIVGSNDRCDKNICCSSDNKCTIDSNEEDYTIFNRVLYIGAAAMPASSSKSKTEILNNISILNSAQSGVLIEVSISVPSNSEGNVIVYDAKTGSKMADFSITSIPYCVNGNPDTPEFCCFGFTCLHGETQDASIHQCHVFKCQIPEAAERVTKTFHAAFNRIPRSKMTKSDDRQIALPLIQTFKCLFDVSLEIKEQDVKGNFNTVSRDKEGFKLRSNTEKQVILIISPTPSSSHNYPINTIGINVKKCFGVLMATGKNVKNSEMNLLETIEMSHYNDDNKSYTITGQWDSKDPAFATLNFETEKERFGFITIATDLVFEGVQDPVRFVIETKVKIFPQNERFWYLNKKCLYHHFSLKLKRVEDSDQGEAQFEVVSMSNLGEVERYKPSAMSLSLNLSSLTSSTLSSLSTGRSPSIASIDTPGGEEDSGKMEQMPSDDDEPLLSGSGEVSKDCPEDQLLEWDLALPKLRQNIQPFPKGVASLVKRGVPEALRGEIWMLLSGCHENGEKELMDAFKELLSKDCPCDQIILRDINRTFTAHDYFREAGGVGQDSLHKISRAYAVYDEEIGYCQGLSFLAAALLLHMPEEQAFCVLVKIMSEYGLRTLFKDNFEVLHLRFFQLDRLMEEYCNDLFHHFHEQGVESHMFASQWFLTLYTSKFPLFMVYHFLDIFLLLGHDSIFQVAIALLKMSKKDLLSLDFEGILKYFRVNLPKKYRNKETARQLFKLSTSLKLKKLKKYEDEYLAIKQQEANQVDPVVTLENLNKKLLNDNMRLENENDMLGKDLVNMKISFQEKMKEMMNVETKVEAAGKEIINLKTLLNDNEEEKKRLIEEIFRVKELLKNEVSKAETTNERNAKIIGDYKAFCSKLSKRIDEEHDSHVKTIDAYKVKVQACERCSGILSPTTGPPCDMTFDPNEDPAVAKLQQENRELEMELAKTKLRLVESECKNGELQHELSSTLNELQSKQGGWFQKTLTSISSLKERTGSVGGVSGATSACPPPSLITSSSAGSLVPPGEVCNQDKG